MPNDRPKKLQRISQACDLCHRRSIRCRPSVENPQHQCQNCYDFGVDCTYQRPSRRRRNRSKTRAPTPSIASFRPDVAASYTRSAKNEGLLQGAAITAQIPRPFVPSHDEHSGNDRVDIAWRCFAIASPQAITENLRVYMEVVYPVMPLFHGPTMWEKIHQRHHLEDRSFFASIMAACALAAARSRDGATENVKVVRNSLGSTDTFFQAARDAIFKDPDQATGFGYLRACALLALASMHSGELPAMHLYLGHYVTLSAVQRFHDEPSWPTDLSIIDREERRRLFWSVYNLDVLASVLFDTVPKCQEAHSNVSYPAEVGDEALMRGQMHPTGEMSWFRGWNIATDLHRIMELSAKRLRWYKNARPNQPAIDQLSGFDTNLDDQIINHVISIYFSLPEHFRALNSPMDVDSRPDPLGFQAVNIQATYQLVRTMILSLTPTLDIHQKCAPIQEMLSMFEPIPRPYLRVISVPLVYQLAAMGNMLVPDIHEVLTEDVYARIRPLLQSLIKFLEELEQGFHIIADFASKGLRNLIGRMDDRMHHQRQMLTDTVVVRVAPSPTQTPDKAKNCVYGTNTAIRSMSTPKSRDTRTPVDEYQLNRGLSGDWPHTWPFDFSQEADGSTLNG